MSHTGNLTPPPSQRQNSTPSRVPKISRSRTRVRLNHFDTLPLQAPAPAPEGYPPSQWKDIMRTLGDRDLRKFLGLSVANVP